MKVIHDQAADTLTIIFTETPVAESDEDKPGAILDYDEKGNLISLEILDASRRVNVYDDFPGQYFVGCCFGISPLGDCEAYP